MFRKKKLYKITYQKMATYTVIIEAVNEFQAAKKFRKLMGNAMYSVVSFDEFNFGRG